MVCLSIYMYTVFDVLYIFVKWISHIFKRTIHSFIHWTCAICDGFSFLFLYNIIKVQQVVTSMQMWSWFKAVGVVSFFVSFHLEQMNINWISPSGKYRRNNVANREYWPMEPVIFFDLEFNQANWCWRNLKIKLERDASFFINYLNFM